MHKEAAGLSIFTLCCYAAAGWLRDRQAAAAGYSMRKTFVLSQPWFPSSPAIGPRPLKSRRPDT